MSWNWAYSKRKQKEMAKKSFDYEQGIEGIKPLYKPFVSVSQANTPEWQKERLKQRRMKIYTTIILTLMCCVYASIIAYFIIYGT